MPENRNLKEWERAEVDNLLRTLAKQRNRNKLIDELTEFAGAVGFRGEAGRVVYAEEIGITDRMIFAAATQNARMANESRAKVIIDALQRAYSLSPLDIEALIKPLLREDEPAEDEEEIEDPEE